MLEKPDLDEETLANCLQERYRLALPSLEFLPVGYDASAWAYRVRGGDGVSYFAKLHLGRLGVNSPAPPGVLIPRALKDLGLEAIVAALPDAEGRLVQPLGDYWLALYPFVQGENAMQRGLSQAQWRAYGTFLGALHQARLPEGLSGILPRETFQPAWAGMVRKIQAGLRQERFRDPISQELADFWQMREGEIAAVLEKADTLGRGLRQQKLAYVICHADIHTANLLIGERGQLWVVDWDGVCLAPRERDLMFVVGDPSTDEKRLHPHQAWFFEGYGATRIDRTALAYYRCEWAVQEIGDFGERVFLGEQGGDLTRRDALQGFKQLFEPGDVMEAAFRAVTG